MIEVRYENHMGDDLDVVNSAKISFGRRSEWEWIKEQTRHGVFNTEKWLSDKDVGLINFLARGCEKRDWYGALSELSQQGWLLNDAEHGSEMDQVEKWKQEFESLVKYLRSMPPHWTPFGHQQIKLYIKVPIAIARQVHKHQTGYVVNEISRRYVTETPEVFFPEFREAVANKKQGSGGPLDLSKRGIAGRLYIDAVEHALKCYDDLLLLGVCPEQARFVLPQGVYTEFVMTGSLYGWSRFWRQRSDAHAQEEIRQVASKVADIIAPLFPVSWKALTNG